MTPSYAVSAHLFAYEPLAFEHLRAAAEAGFARVELWAMAPHFDIADEAALARLKGWLEAASLEAVSFHAPFYAHLDEARAGRWLSLADPAPAARRRALERTEAAMRAFAGLGARIAVLHPCAPGAAAEADPAGPLRESIETLLPLAEALGLRLALENIPAPFGRAEPLAAFVEEISHPRLGVCLDAGHAYLSEGEGAGAAFRRLAPLAIAAHLHDNDGERDAHLPPGEGGAPWDILWEAFESAGYAGPLAFELRRREGVSYAETLSALGESLARAPWTPVGGASPGRGGRP
ncbi:MAG: sugar phosphate isomerase/epimerase family protein [bacterium]